MKCLSIFIRNARAADIANFAPNIIGTLLKHFYRGLTKLSAHYEVNNGIANGMYEREQKQRHLCPVEVRLDLNVGMSMER